MRLLLAIAAASSLAACGGPNRTPFAAAPGTEETACLPNLDGVIDASEMRPAIGQTLAYDVSTGVTVDLAGRPAGGRTLWDFSNVPAGTTERVGPEPIAGKWFESSFPTGTFVLPLDDAGTLDAVYRFDTTALWLLGTASVDESPAAGRTLLVYDTPVPVYRFPITAGATWTSTATVTGTIDGLPYRGTDTYAATVGDAGELRLPDVTFTQVLPVHFTVTTTPDPGTPVIVRQVSFLFECFGEVARATSNPGEPDPDFSNAASFRRLTLEAR